MALPAASRSWGPRFVHDPALRAGTRSGAEASEPDGPFDRPPGLRSLPETAAQVARDTKQ